jgi:antirestriction protein ArdC
VAGRQTGKTTDVYQDVTNRMIKALESGVVPWDKPWRATVGRPVSMSTRKFYRGVNVMLLGLTAMEQGYSSPWWGTYKQISELGGQVRKGEKSTLVVFFKQLEVADDKLTASGDPAVKRIPLLRAFRVFNAEQCDDLPARYYPQPEGTPVAELPEPQAVLDAYFTGTGPKLRHVAQDRAYYQGATDTVTLPERSQFASPEAYYNIAFHEAGHSTGHPSRNNRAGIAEFDHFGSEKYAKEELCAQMASAMLLAETGTETPAEFTRSAAYVANWLGALRDDRKLVVSAAAQAERAAERVMEPTRQAIPEPQEIAQKQAA